MQKVHWQNARKEACQCARASVRLSGQAIRCSRSVCLVDCFVIQSFMFDWVWNLTDWAESVVTDTNSWRCNYFWFHLPDFRAICSTNSKSRRRAVCSFCVQRFCLQFVAASDKTERVRLSVRASLSSTCCQKLFHILPPVALQSCAAIAANLTAGNKKIHCIEQNDVNNHVNIIIAWSSKLKLNSDIHLFIYKYKIYLLTSIG